MMRSRSILLAAVLLVCIAPALASAGPLTNGCRDAAGTTTCVYEFRYTDGCFDWGSTTLYTSTGGSGAFIGGYSANDCDVTSSRGIFAGAYGPGFYELVAWRTTGSAGGTSCDTTAYGTTGPQSFGCPAGSAPNPGWGQLLP